MRASIGHVVTSRPMFGVQTKKRAFGIDSAQYQTHQQSGQGLIENVQKLIKVAKGADKFASGEVGTFIKNIIPSSDTLARPSFVGERHAPLRLPNGKIGIANYMGPGTQLIKRIKRGDPPRTMSDKVAQAHDIRYALAKDQSGVASADKKMIRKLKDMIKKKQGNKFNINIGLRGIQAKSLAERSGVVKPGAIASFGDTADADVPMLKAKLAQLEQEGFGPELPGAELKKQILSKLRRQARGHKRNPKAKHRRPKRRHKKAQAGRGDGCCKLAKHLTNMTARKVVPLIVTELKGQGMKGMSKGMTSKQKSALYMATLKALNDGASADKRFSRYNLTGNGLSLAGGGLKLAGQGMTKKKFKNLAKSMAKGLMPILLNLAVKKMTGGASVSMEQLRKRASDPSLLDKLSRKLFDIFTRKMKDLIMPKRKLQMGSGFFKDFARGFMKVMKPVMAVGKVVAPVLPLLL